MEQRSFVKLIFACLLLIACASLTMAQDTPQWKVGDKVETLNLSQEWVPGTVIGIVDWRAQGRGIRYRVQLDDANAPNVYFNSAPAESVRARGGQPAAGPAGGPANDRPAGNNANTPGRGAFKVGDLVDTYYGPNQGRDRGTVIAVQGNNYKVRFIGCNRDETLDWSLVLAPATISANAPEITFLFGKWSLTKVGMFSGGMAWGKAEGIQINADGTYIWFQGAGKQPVRGRWVTDAKIPGKDMGTEKFDGVLIKDAMGRDWKAFRWVVKSDDHDGIQVQRMCDAESVVGSRAR
jgi:hypothetical protein